MFILFQLIKGIKLMTVIVKKKKKWINLIFTDIFVNILVVFGVYFGLSFL